jgi:hypothetical protein
MMQPTRKYNRLSAYHSSSTLSISFDGSADAGRDIIISIMTRLATGSEGQALCFLISTHSDFSDSREREDIVMAPDPFARSVKDAKELLKKRHEGTGEWFLKSEILEKWKTTPCGTLWIRGIRMFLVSHRTG